MLTSADTAYAVAHVRALESGRPAAEQLFDDPYAAAFDAAGDHARDGTERFVSLPMFVDAVRLRTRFIDEFVRKGLDDGLGQIVLLGAGFDARANRLPEIETHGARVYEVDFDTQLEKKRSILANAGITLPPWVDYVPCDFSVTDFDAKLLSDLVARGFRRDAGVLFVWEGVIAYISDEALDRSLRFMATAGGPGSRLVFDFSPMSFNEAAADRTKRLGFARFEEVGCDELWRRRLPEPPHENAWVMRMGTAFV